MLLKVQALCAAILYSTDGGDPVLQIDTSPSNLAIEGGVGHPELPFTSGGRGGKPT